MLKGRVLVRILWLKATETDARTHTQHTHNITIPNTQTCAHTRARSHNLLEAYSATHRIIGNAEKQGFKTETGASDTRGGLSRQHHEVNHFQ